jgi:hypothetical protein
MITDSSSLPVTKWMVHPKLHMINSDAHLLWNVIALRICMHLHKHKTLIILLSDLFVCLFVYSHTSNYSAIWRRSPLPVTGLHI